jgi:transposase
MSRAERRTFSREFKLAAVNRVLSGENVSALARELNVLRKDLYKWRDGYRARGPDGLRSIGRPPKSAAAAAPATARAGPPDELTAARGRIAELERKVGQQHLELDFFRQALRQVRATRRPSDGPGATASIASSKR